MKPGRTKSRDYTIPLKKKEHHEQKIRKVVSRGRWLSNPNALRMEYQHILANIHLNIAIKCRYINNLKYTMHVKSGHMQMVGKRLPSACKMIGTWLCSAIENHGWEMVLKWFVLRDTTPPIKMSRSQSWINTATYPILTLFFWQSD